MLAVRPSAGLQSWRCGCRLFGARRSAPSGLLSWTPVVGARAKPGDGRSGSREQLVLDGWPAE